jgi:CheY-like chemotaxis protein
MHDETHPSAPLSVLIVEDQADAADSLSAYLELACGCRVTVARDGQAGIDAALRDRPDAIVSDIGLPKRNGLELGAEVTRALPRKPLLIAVSGYSREEYADRARRAGFDAFFVKPADPEALADLLRARAAA